MDENRECPYLSPEELITLREIIEDYGNRKRLRIFIREKVRVAAFWFSIATAIVMGAKAFLADWIGKH